MVAMSRSALSALGRRTKPPPISWLMRLKLSHPRLISLAAGFTDDESLPVKEVRELLHGILRSRETGRRALQYGPTQGDTGLRELTARHVKQLDRLASTNAAPTARGSRSMATGPYSPERVLITNGSQQTLYMLTEALCDEGDIVLVEDPTYFVYLGILHSNLKIISVTNKQLH